MSDRPTRPPRPPACKKCDALWTPGHVCDRAVRLSGEEAEQLRREAYRHLYPGHVNTHDSKRTRESDLREADLAYKVWDEKRAGFAPTSIITELVERMTPVVESIVASRERAAAERAWDEGWDECAIHKAVCDHAGPGVCKDMPPNPYARQEDRNG